MQCALLNTPMATRQYVNIVSYLSNVQTLVRYTSEWACKDWHTSIVSSPLGQRAEACLLTLTFVVVSTKTNRPFERVISPTVRKQSPESDTLSRTIGLPPYLTPSRHSPYLPARMDYSTGRRRLRFPVSTKQAMEATWGLTLRAVEGPVHWDPATGFTWPSLAIRGPHSGGTSSLGAFDPAVVLGGRDVRDA